MDKWDIISTNPWDEVAQLYVTNEFLLSDKDEYICKGDKPYIEAFNNQAKPEERFILNIPAYPWYGNPLTAKVIVLSLNPGYNEREDTIARIIQNLHLRLSEGYTEHLRKMLTFNVDGFLPSDEKHDGVSYRDIANLHQCWYWEDRLNSAFVNAKQDLTFEEINQRFAVIEYIGYSSKQKPSKQFSELLPSQKFTKQLIQFILHNNEDTLFIVARSENEWRRFLGNVWDENRFFVSKAYRGQHISKKSLGEEVYNKVLNAFKS